MQGMAQATADYEAWLGSLVPLYEPDLLYKHQQMASKEDSFSFFRGTYYRWAQRWQHMPAELIAAPRVPSIGDLHVENFGTWRDAEGRLAWGVNDFDEAEPLPYTQDLTRLAASISFARRQLGLTMDLSEGCRLVLKGYRQNLEQGGKPFVLEEKHPHLRAMALGADRDPVVFWAKFEKLLAQPAAEPPAAAKKALLQDLPDTTLRPQFRRRRAGVGSLGKPRYVAMVPWSGSWIARETKAAAPPSTRWLAGDKTSPPQRLSLFVAATVRCGDPFYRATEEWITRRLGPHCSRVELSEDMPSADIATLFQAMGAETANIHLADRAEAQASLEDLKARGDDWLQPAAHDLVKQIEADWQDWRGALKGQ